MLRTDKEMVELRFKDDWNNTKNAIVDRFKETFQKHPNYFFTEHDIHSVLYSIAEEELHQCDVLTATTREGHEVILVHHEYPTPFRCDMRDYEFRRASEEERTPKGGLHRRGYYDLVILNPEFVRNYELPVIYGKDYQRFQSALEKVEVKPLIWACEVVFFPRVKKLPRNALKIIEQDTLKVEETLRYKVGKNIHFCEMGSVLVFTSHTPEEALDLKQQVTRLRETHKFEVALLIARD